MRRSSQWMVAGTATLLMVVMMFYNGMSPGPGNTSNIITPNSPSGQNKDSECHVPGLESIEQYRAYLHHAEVQCNNLKTFGGKPPAPDAGKKRVCLDDRFNIQPGNCVVFSFGVNNEWSFEDDFDKFGCKVYAYDPTMGKKDHQRSPNIKFMAKGIASYNGTKNIGMEKNWSMQKVDRFENLVREAGVEGREIDYVKLDVELSEIDFMQDMLFNSPHVLAAIKQIGMEVHDGPFKGDLSQASLYQVFWPYFMKMRCAGFRLIHTRETWGWREVLWGRYD
ncbi:Methyltransferase-like protein 24 [Chionoecetes opilio]|uniref:Methyltransferase-like protein 24 n=1 Tax=Chionoecetes opilio TaxID=41210 RepID=A0A8J4YQI9_CHIOP|nr:Methyltransferase-like protein 24 [Chionoecetes opilio]